VGFAVICRWVVQRYDDMTGDEHFRDERWGGGGMSGLSQLGTTGALTVR